MTQFSVNTHRFDPYKGCKFLVRHQGKIILGVSKVSALKRTTEVVEHREGGDPSMPRRSPGVSKTEAITMERGVTHDPDFETWANLVNNTDGDAAMSLKHFRRDLIVQLLNEQGEVAKAYNVYRCWVSEYQALPELDANGNVIAIESIVMQNEGWERDENVPEPAET